MRVTIPDEVADHYAVYAKRQGRSVEDVCAAQLARFVRLEPGKKAIVIPAAFEKPLADKLGGMPVRDGADLVDRMDRLAHITFAGIQIPLTPNQLAELQYRAERQGRTVESLVLEIWEALSYQFFNSSGGGPAKGPAGPAQPAGPAKAPAKVPA